MDRLIKEIQNELESIESRVNARDAYPDKEERGMTLEEFEMVKDLAKAHYYLCEVEHYMNSTKTMARNGY